MGCAMGTIRYIIFFFNFLLVIIGFAACAAGLYELYTKDSTLNSVMPQDDSGMNTAAITFAIVGGLIFSFAFFGCWGAMRENRCMIISYALMLIILLLAQVLVAVLVFYYRGQTEDIVGKTVTKYYQGYGNDTEITAWVDKIQNQFECCGSTNNTTPWTTIRQSTPLSCYPDKDPKNKIYAEGCVPKLIDLANSMLTNMGRVCIIIAAVQVVGIVFSLCLASSIGKSKQRRGY